MAFVSLKHGEVFSVTNDLGDMDSTVMGTGLYFKDTRFLKKYDMKINGQSSIFLTKKQNKGIENQFKLSNGDIHNGDSHYEKMDLEINRSQLIYEDVFYDHVEIINGSRKTIDCVISFSIDTLFEDIFEVRGAKRSQRGTQAMPEIKDNQLLLSYTGLDQIVRVLYITGAQGVEIIDQRLEYHMNLEPGKRQTIENSFQVLVNDNILKKQIIPYSEVKVKAEQALDMWVNKQAKIVTSDSSINRTLKQAEFDLYMLATDMGQGHFPVAGIPWFCVPFGRDSILTAVQTMILNPSLAKSTLKTLAAVQGNKENHWNEEAPGKILHEMRSGEMSNLNEVPFKRYYGSIDATPLFIILFVETVRWTGDITLMEELLPNVEEALKYLERYADLDGDKFIEFHNESGEGLAVQSWKDSNHSMVHKNGDYSESPMAVVEVQGYLFDAKQKMSELYNFIGQHGKATQLLEEAIALKETFNKAFWIEHENYFALALDKKKEKIQTITSDPGHCLWSGIISEDKRVNTANRLLSEDLFSGWGIRTMSKVESVYSPVAYHNGTVWPHDNSIVALGLSKYGFRDHVSQITSALFKSAEQFEDNRLPELFCGHDKVVEDSIIPFPVACSPQAWAAGTPFALIQALLGIEVNSFDRIVNIHATLPNELDWLECKGISIGNGSIDLRVNREEDGKVSVEFEANTSGYVIQVKEERSETIV